MAIDFFRFDLEDDPFDMLSEEEIDELLGKEDFELPDDLLEYSDDDGLFDFEDEFDDF